jgi:TatD DNase family protein
MLYFDTHAHYDLEEFDKDRNELFDKFKETLCGIVNIGINIESANKVIEYANTYSYMYYALGIHPMEVEKEISIKSIEEIIEKELKSNTSKLVAIGETGLDYHFNYPIELQKKYFVEQIKLANKYDLPIIIHSRESQEDVEKILKENRVTKAGIMHCYSGTPEMSKKFIEMGYYLGVGGPVTRYRDIQETIRITPIDKIVIETDSPVLPPEPFEKHSRNNSLYLKYIVRKIAEIKGLSEEDVIKYTTQNAYTIYGINQ